MTGIDIFSLFVMVVLVVTGLGIFVFLGTWPGRVARRSNHRQVQAITIGSWVALIAGGVLWPLVLIWAHCKPVSCSEEMRCQLDALERRLAAVENRDAAKGGAA